MKIVARTDKGVVRDNNQDSYTTFELEGGAVLAVVCDGMGGEAYGELASLIAVKSLVKYADKKINECINDYVTYANKLICNEIEKNFFKIRYISLTFAIFCSIIVM